MKSHKATYSHHEKVTRNSFAFSVLFLLFCEFNLQFKPKDRGEREKLYLENILSKHSATEMVKTTMHNDNGEMFFLSMSSIK